MGVALLRTTMMRPSSPLKVNLCLTYWCQYRCKTCNIWQRKPSDELTTAEVLGFVRENPNVTWADLTGGEIFLRPDIDEVLGGIVRGWRRLAVLHFPTNGFLTDRIVASVERIAGKGPAKTIVTVSVDGNESLNDRVRGVKGGFRRQLGTFNRLRRIPHVSTVLGVTLSTHNVGQFAQTFEACKRECPDLTIDDVHLNVAQTSAHYYGNDNSDGVTPTATAVRAELNVYRSLRGRARSPEQLLENTYLNYLDQFLSTGRTPMPCHALRASCFIDPWGVVYPCISYSRPIGRLRDTGMRLGPIWNGAEATAVQREVWDGHCPQCWTACEAYQAVLGNVLAGRRTPRYAGVRPPAPGGIPPSGGPP